MNSFIRRIFLCMPVQSSKQEEPKESGTTLILIKLSTNAI